MGDGDVQASMGGEHHVRGRITACTGGANTISNQLNTRAAGVSTTAMDFQMGGAPDGADVGRRVKGAGIMESGRC
jgi:hypothetical protein